MWDAASSVLEDNTEAMVGSQLGPYRIDALLGAGGMGQVYRATDTRLHRTVAIKILPQALAADPQFRARFDREAQTIASFQHPHICTLHDIGRQDGVDFLVMEHLDGGTLAARLTRGPLPVEQALRYAIEIVEALAAAHQHRIVHRDLKPGNIMLTKDGAKLLDFGLAKATGGSVLSSIAAGSRGEHEAPVPASLATTAAPLTAQGTILGTFQYMAPEQLEGQEADERTDIFAFGAIVYEMLTGRRAFEGKSEASLIGAIMHADPAPITRIQPLTPPALDHVVKTCLAKAPSERWQNARDLLHEMTWIAGVASRVEGPARAGGRNRRRERLIWLAVLAIVALASAAVPMVMRRFESSPTEMRLEISTPPTEDPASLAISPDGQSIVFVGDSDGKSKLWLRPLNAPFSARPLERTERASNPFWSPDSRSIGFFADAMLKRFDLDGGAVRSLARAFIPRGGSWSGHGVILFTSLPSILRVSSEGGQSTGVTQALTGQTATYPTFLPDGRHFLYYVVGASPERRGVYVGELDKTETTRLFDADAAAVFAPPDHLLFVWQGKLFAQGFDPHGLVAVGSPWPVADQVDVNEAASHAALSASSAGLIVYRRKAATRQRRQFEWVNRAGDSVERLPVPDDGGVISPDAALSSEDRYWRSTGYWTESRVFGDSILLTAYRNT